MAKMVKCKTCGEEIAKSAKTCPHCGAKVKRFPLLPIVLILILLGLISTAMGGGNSQRGTSGGNVGNQQEAQMGAERDSTHAETENQTETSKLTTGQRNALNAAKAYLNTMPFSHDGLVAQLEFSGFENADAVYAADNCGADWNGQAVSKAKNYLYAMSFSYKGMIEQLEFDHFTKEEATYGADNCQADWNEQAVKKAEDYLNIMPFSRDGLIEQLVFDGFSREQAEYGASQNGY